MKKYIVIFFLAAASHFSIAKAQHLSDEREVLKQMTPGDASQIPNDICQMRVNILNTRMTFCDYARRTTVYGKRSGMFVALPMITVKPPNQLVEMVGIPVRHNGDGEVMTILFKNSGGTLIYGGMIRYSRYENQSVVGGRYLPPEGPQADFITLQLMLAFLGSVN